MACLKIFVEDVIGVVGGDETLHGQTHPLAEQTCADVSEIAGWDANNHLIGLAHTLQLSVGVEIIERLGKETGHIDGVGGSELHVGIQIRIHEGGLHQTLAIVEHAVNLNCCDVLA